MTAMIEIPQTEVTFDFAALMRAAERAERAFIDPDFAAHIGKSFSSAEVDRLRRDAATQAESLYSKGKVGVSRAGEGICLHYKGETTSYRGSSVQGCDYSDSFVQTLARDFIASVTKPD